MPQTPVTTDIHQPFDTQLNFLTKISFDPTFVLDDLTKTTCFFLRKCVHFSVDIDAGLFANLSSPCFPDAVNVRQGDLDSLVIRDVDSCYSHLLLRGIDDLPHPILSVVSACVSGLYTGLGRPLYAL
jgi:hypothetical protein